MCVCAHILNSRKMNERRSYRRFKGIWCTLSCFREWTKWQQDLDWLIYHHLSRRLTSVLTFPSVKTVRSLLLFFFFLLLLFFRSSSFYVIRRRRKWLRCVASNSNRCSDPKTVSDSNTNHSKVIFQMVVSRNRFITLYFLFFRDANKAKLDWACKTRRVRNKEKRF